MTIQERWSIFLSAPKGLHSQCSRNPEVLDLSGNKLQILTNSMYRSNGFRRVYAGHQCLKSQHTTGHRSCLITNYHEFVQRKNWTGCLTYLIKVTHCIISLVWHCSRWRGHHISPGDPGLAEVGYHTDWQLAVRQSNFAGGSLTCPATTLTARSCQLSVRTSWQLLTRMVMEISPRRNS